MPLTDDELAQLKELLGKADPKELPAGFLTQDTLVGRLKDKDRGWEAKLAQEQAAAAEARRKHEEAQAKIREYEEKGMSAEQKIAAALAEKEARIEALQAEKDAESVKAAEQRAALLNERLQNELTAMLGASPHRPVRLDHALALARLELSPSMVEVDGRTSMQYTRDGISAPLTPEVLDAWWKPQTHLHAKGSETVPPGAGRPPGDPPPKDPTEGMSAAQAFAYGLANFATTDDPVR